MGGFVDLKLGTDNDLAFEDGDLVLIDGAEACAQLIRARLLTIKGELKWDTRVGFPHFELTGETDVDLARVNAWVRHAVGTTPGVQSVSSLEMTFDAADRVLIFEGEAIYEDGTPIELSETLKIEVK